MQLDVTTSILGQGGSLLPRQHPTALTGWVVHSMLMSPRWDRAVHRDPCPGHRGPLPCVHPKPVKTNRAEPTTSSCLFWGDMGDTGPWLGMLWVTMGSRPAGGGHPAVTPGVPKAGCPLAAGLGVPAPCGVSWSRAGDRAVTSWGPQSHPQPQGRTLLGGSSQHPWGSPISG